MICAHTTARFVREFDQFRTRVGLPTSGETYTSKSERELHENASRLRMEDRGHGGPQDRDR
jgi:hypothetical protein